MSNNYVIITDSSCDIPAEKAEKMGITVFQLDVLVEGDSTVPNNKIDIKEFYAKLRAKKGAKTSAVNTGRFLDGMDKILAEGADILYLGFSSALSGTYNAGFVAAKELCDKYPQRKILTVDTLAASLGEGLLVWYAVQKKNEGATIEETYKYIENIKLNLCHWFTVDDLFFLKRGGRVSAATAVVGTMLSIKPILHVDNEGRLINVGKARGRKGSLAELCSRMEKSAVNASEQTIFISHGDCLEDAEYLASMIREKMGVKEIYISDVGPVIGAHSGPGTVALFFIGHSR